MRVPWSTFQDFSEHWGGDPARRRYLRSTRRDRHSIISQPLPNIRPPGSEQVPALVFIGLRQKGGCQGPAIELRSETPRNYGDLARRPLLLLLVGKRITPDEPPRCDFEARAARKLYPEKGEAAFDPMIEELLAEFRIAARDFGQEVLELQ